MKINELKFYLYSQAFKSPIVTPKVSLDKRECLVIELITDTGDTYFGECNAFKTQWYDKETISSVKQQIEQWFVSIKNKDVHSFEEWQALLNTLNHCPAARSTVVMALYQMYYKLKAFKVEYGATVSGWSDAQFATLKQTQPKRIKLKYSNQLISDINKLKSLEFPFDIVIDANESLDINQYQEINKNTKQNILYIEEPFANINTLKQFDDEPQLPIAIDEKATSIDDIQYIVSHYPIDTVVLKPFRLGGIDRVIETIDYLKNSGINIVVGGMYEYGLSRYFTAMLSQYGDYPGDVTPAGYYFENDFVENEGILKEGMIAFIPPVVDRSKLECINGDV